MKKSNSLKNERNLYLLIIIAYCILAAGVLLINVFNWQFGGLGFFADHSSVNSVAVSIQITLMLYLVVTRKKHGYILSVILGLINLAILAVPLVFYGEKETVITIIMQVISLILNTVVYSFAVRLEKKEKELYKVAYMDSLTNLPNRNAFNEKIKQCTDGSSIDQNKQVALVAIDLDNFKVINDTMGRDVGDNVLIEIVTRCKFVMKNNDELYRLDGDQFALVVEDFGTKDMLLQHINEFNECIKRKITEGSSNFFLTAAFGVTLYPDDTLDGEDLIRYADIALFNAQSSLKSGVVFFNERMLNTIESDREMVNVLRENISKGAFELVFQPQFRANTKTLRGFETLLRMKDGKGRPVSPAAFIPIAERSGSIIEIDRFVLNKAMETFKDIVTKNNDLTISVNISAVHLFDADLVADVKEALKNNDFPAQNLEIEITESVCIESMDHAVQVLNKIKEMGIKIALDDFGTGYAALSYLKKLPIDLLKIDKSFIDEIENGQESSDFVAAIISMGHLLKFGVISEGVEHEVQLDTLKKLNCDYIQGYLWGKPMDIDNAKELIENAG